jgi:3-methyladenine DNA glycosylase Mpg
METLGLNNRVLKTLSQSSAKAAVDILGMRLSTTIKDKFVEIMITETEAYGRKNTDKMALFNTYKNIPTSLTLGPPHMSVLRSYGSNRGLFLLTGKKGSGEAVLIKSGKILIIDLSPRIHPLDQAIARPRKNAKRNDKNLWRFTLIIK